MNLASTVTNHIHGQLLVYLTSRYNHHKGNNLLPVKNFDDQRFRCLKKSIDSTIPCRDIGFGGRASDLCVPEKKEDASNGEGRWRSWGWYAAVSDGGAATASQIVAY
jgi:hypothetical protein